MSKSEQKISNFVRDGATVRRRRPDDPPEQIKRTITLKPEIDAEARVPQIRSAMLRALPSMAVVPAHARTMVLACYGPSLRETWRDIDPAGDLFSVSGAHDYMIERGLIPRGHIECDPRAHKARFVSSPHREVTYFIASCCHRAMFDALYGYRVVLWHSAQSQLEDSLIEGLEPGAFVVLGGSTVGTRAVCVGTALGYRDFDIHGMDCSFGEGYAQHAAAHPNEVGEILGVRQACGVDLDHVYPSSMQMIGAIKDFIDLVHQTQDCSYRLRGDGLLRELARLANVSRVA